MMTSSEDGDTLDIPMALWEDDPSPRVTKLPMGNNIMLCGFTTQPIQNRALFKLLQDLSNAYFVCCQPSPPDPFNIHRLRKNLTRADVCVFYMYEGSLIDKRCLACVQSAWELMVPIVILRHPRMKLVMSPITVVPGPHAHNEPDYQLLQEIFSDGYRQSLPYNHLHHNAGLRVLTKRLAAIITDSKNRPASPQPYSLKIPNAKSVNHCAGLNDRYAVDIKRSTSVNNLSDSSSKKKKGPRPSSARSRRRKQRTEGYEDELEDDSSSPSSYRIVGRLSSSDEDALLKNSWSLDEPQIYHTTQYIIFPSKVTDKSLQPTKVMFPNDVIHSALKPQDSVWQSDASDSENVEDTVKQIEELQGGFDIQSSPTGLAPYEKPLE